MNTRRVNGAAGVINAALAQCRTAAGIALALESAQLLMTPETAAELVALRARVAELEAAEKVRADRLERCRVDAVEQARKESDPGRRAAWRMLAGQTSEGEHYAAVHHDYRVGHDLPELGGQR